MSTIEAAAGVIAAASREVGHKVLEAMAVVMSLVAALGLGMASTSMPWQDLAR